MKKQPASLSVSQTLCSPRACVIALSLFLAPIGLLAQAEWGNSFNMGNTSGSVTVTDTNSVWTTFTANDDYEVAKIWLNSNNAQAASTVLDVGIFALDVDGKPTGSALATQTLSDALSGWTEVGGFSYTLTSGTPYAIRVSANTGNPSYGWRFLNSNLAAPFDNTNTVQPGTGNFDPNWGRGNNTNGPFNNGTIVWMLETTGGTTFGQPYNTGVAQNVASASLAYGQRFRFDAPDPINQTLTGVELMLSIAATPPTEPLTLHLLSDAGAILSTGSLDLSSATNGLNRYTVDLDTSVSLSDGSFYYLATYSNGSAGNSVTMRGSGNLTTDPFRDAGFQGQDGYAVLWGSQSDFSSPSINLDRDYYFNLALIPEPSTILFIIAPVLLLIGRRLTRKV